MTNYFEMKVTDRSAEKHGIYKGDFIQCIHCGEEEVKNGQFVVIADQKSDMAQLGRLYRIEDKQAIVNMNDHLMEGYRFLGLALSVRRAIS